MSNAWGITEEEFRLARRLSADETLTSDERDDCFQLCRFYLGSVFYRDAAERGAKLVRERLAS